ncbi:MAG TPA: serine protease [Planctomicrobium sp.]|nr:serine protease [Planctomicrobium sp.]
MTMPSFSIAQTVGLPTPRLLTMMPMGGKAGTTFEVTVTGEHVDDLESELLFSNPGIKAVHSLVTEGELVTGRFLVTIAGGTPPGQYDARMMTPLGISSDRTFTVGTLPEVIRETPNVSLETAMTLNPSCVCNAFTTERSIDYYRFKSRQGERTVIECAASQIDSQLIPVLIVGDAEGQDLKVDRLNGRIEFTAPDDGSYVIKVHGQTFQGGPSCFYRLVLTRALPDVEVAQQAKTRQVHSFSAPVPTTNSSREMEPNDEHAQAQKVSLPIDCAGQFFPAADVDTFEFEAKKSEEWWIEVVSQRLGLPTNPFVLVQRVIPSSNGEPEQLKDVVELSDIRHPIKISTFGYTYNGPPYQPGCADVLGKLVIPEDGTYRLQLRDLYGATRSDPLNQYRLIVRRATPDFALVAWAMHMELRNGDRNALSKPIALRPGATMAFEVVALRKDGFDGEIEISMEGLPSGISATGLKIPTGKNMGWLVITANENAQHGWSTGRILGKSVINGQTCNREAAVASMAWPIRDRYREMMSPRLMEEVPVSVGHAEVSPLTIAAAEGKVHTAIQGEKLTVPLKFTWRSEFSGALELRPIGDGFESAKPISVALNAPTLDAVFDTASLKLPPGKYTIALFGGVVAKHKERPDRLKAAEEADQLAEKKLQELVAAVESTRADLAMAPDEQKQGVKSIADHANAALEKAKQMKEKTAATFKAAMATSTPKDIIDIIVSEPIHIVIQPGTGS